MLLKEADNKEPALNELKARIEKASGKERDALQKQFNIMNAGIRGERDAAYFLDFDYKDSKNWVLIHDLRLEINGRVAQIDHLMINRLLCCLVLETKHFKNGLRITETGEFERWNDYAKAYEGMPSPLQQNERHILVLQDAFKAVDMPSRLGFRLSPTFHPFVLVAPDARIIRPEKFDTSKVIKADSLHTSWEKTVDKMSGVSVLTNAAKMVGEDTLVEIARQLVAMHKPKPDALVERFATVKGASGPLPAEEAKKVAAPPLRDYALPKCRTCNSESLSILYGQYGYYFKCADCQGNTPAKVQCGKEGHKERLRKDGRTFYRECADCGTSSVFYVNPA